mmetsp:Transcript_97845/g.169456  ORF Transcript_97845/g.169456 Transcript_97845/m.169456 type:complete len:184 (+) Transcript_97845:98-649(+)
MQRSMLVETAFVRALLLLLVQPDALAEASSLRNAGGRSGTLLHRRFLRASEGPPCPPPQKCNCWCHCPETFMGVPPPPGPPPLVALNPFAPPLPPPPGLPVPHNLPPIPADTPVENPTAVASLLQDEQDPRYLGQPSTYKVTLPCSGPSCRAPEGCPPPMPCNCYCQCRPPVPSKSEAFAGSR